MRLSLLSAMLVLSFSTTACGLMGQPLGGHHTVPGKADDVRVYGRALTRLEIQRLAGW